MKIEINVNGQAAAAMAAQLGAIAGPNLIAAIRGGLITGLDLAASRVWSLARARGLGQGTGTLGSAVRGWLDVGDAASGKVGVDSDNPAARYAWLLTDERKTIVPVGAKALSIPFGENLTRAGVARYPTVRSLIDAFGELVFFKKRFIGVRSKTKRGSWKLYFILAMSSKPKPVNALEPGVEGAVPDMTAEIQDRVDDLLKGVK